MADNRARMTLPRGLFEEIRRRAGAHGFDNPSSAIIYAARRMLDDWREADHAVEPVDGKLEMF